MGRQAGIALGRLLDEATAALTRLDADELQDLELRALNLQALAQEGVAVTATPETVARFRLFAAVTAAAGENLRVLRRGAAYGRGGRTPWDR